MTRVVAKTVVGVLALEWILGVGSPTGVWVRRHPLDVVAGRQAMGLDVALEAIDDAVRRRAPDWYHALPRHGAIARQSWYTGLAMSWCRGLAQTRREIVEVTHEALCQDPVGEFRRLAGRLDLEWTAEAERVLCASNAPGTGWSTTRITAEQPGKWRFRRTADEQREAIAVLSRFPIAGDDEVLA